MRTAPIFPSAEAVNMAAPARISQAELTALIAKHREWVESNGTTGRRAFAGPLNLCGMDLRGVNASGAIFHVMLFDGLDLRKADFRTATLEGAIFRNVRAGSKTRFDQDMPTELS